MSKYLAFRLNYIESFFTLKRWALGISDNAFNLKLVQCSGK